MLCNSNFEVCKYGKQLTRKYLPLDFSEIYKDHNPSEEFDLLQNTRARNVSLMKSSYINLHGEEFEENQTEDKKTGKEAMHNLL